MISDYRPGSNTSIEVERSDRSKQEIAANNLDPNLLLRGDHVHIDFGISYLNLQTDTQQMPYPSRRRDGGASLAATGTSKRQ